MEKQRKEVITLIRGCLISLKGNVTLRQLDNDYLTLAGKRIPYGQLGYKNLEEFLQSEPSLIVRTLGNDKIVDAKLSEKSSHITEMVHKQKSSKKPSSLKAVRFNPNTSQRPNKWRAQSYNTRPKTKIVQPDRPTKVLHNQFVDRPNTRSGGRPQEMPRKKSDLGERLNLGDKNSVNASPPVVSKENKNGYVNDGSTLANAKKRIAKKMSETSIDESCSSLASAKRRITKKMSEISLDRDSGNSSPTSDQIVPTPRILPEVIEFIQTGDPMEDLKNFVDTYKIGELECSCVQVKSKNAAGRFYTCKIKVGKSIFVSYPEEFRDPKEAEKYCAKAALKELMPKHTRRKFLLLASQKDILERVPPMLEKHNHGIWGWQLELDYEDIYNEQLPTDWLKIIDSSACIQVEKCQDNYVLRHCKPGDVLQKGQKWNTFMTISDVSVPSNTVQFGENGRLVAQITCAVAANELWCRQCDNTEFRDYNDMNYKMEMFYKTNSANLKATNIAEGGYYVAHSEMLWYRVRAIDITDDTVRCFMIDFGDELTLTRDVIYQIKREFAKCHAQAFVCRLVGLEELYQASCYSEVLQKFIGKQVFLELGSEDYSENSIDLSLPVYMSDCETGASINQQLIPLLTIESASPILQPETVNEVFVSNIEPNGDVYVQAHSRGYDSLMELLKNLEAEVVNSPLNELQERPTRQNSANKVYFAKYNADGHWYRVKIIDWAPQDEFAQIYFVDYGNTDIITIGKDILYPLEKLSDVLSQYPFQALKVKMCLDEVPEDFVDLATKLMPDDKPVLLKIRQYDDIDNCPVVEFFKRSADGGLFCINKSIVMESEIKKGNSYLKSSKRKVTAFTDGLGKNVPSGGTLSKPPLPEKGGFLEVHISFAVNPYNFFVQPLQTRVKLDVMMERLQLRYQDVLYSPLQTEDIIPGQIYASKHDDGYWYRTSVIKVIHCGSISVFYCDFGYYANLTVNQLIPLDMEFMDLPYQALKAKLAGIKPKQSKWTMEDCEHFKETVEKKNFYSVLMDIEKDELYASDIVLKLTLIDTSQPEDIYIGKELIKKGIAIDC